MCHFCSASSGGLDLAALTHLCSPSLAAQEHPVNVSPSPQLPVLQAVHAAGTQQQGSSSSQREQQPPWLLCAQRCDVDLWQLAEAKPQGQVGPPSEGVLLPPASAPQHLLRVVAQSGRHVSTAAISQDRRWLAYSDSHRVSCFALDQQTAGEDMPEDHVVPAPLQVPADLPAACHLAFRPGTSELVACASDGTLHIIDVSRLASARTGKARGGSSGSDGLGPLRALHDLQYKSSFRRDRQRNVARRLMPLVELMSISLDGRRVGRMAGEPGSPCRQLAGWPPFYVHTSLSRQCASQTGRCLHANAEHLNPICMTTGLDEARACTT